MTEAELRGRKGTSRGLLPTAREVDFVRHGLREHPARTLFSVAGVAFPIVFLFVQLGLDAAMMRTATLYHDHLAFDVALVSQDYLFFSRPGTIPRHRLFAARSAAGVDEVAPLYLGFAPWPSPRDGARTEMLVLGVDPARRPFVDDLALPGFGELTRPGTLLADRLSRPQYGDLHPGLRNEMQGERIEVVGTYELGGGFAALGAGLVGLSTYRAIFGAGILERIALGLITIDPGADPEAVAERLRSSLPRDTQAVTRPQLESIDRAYWRRATSLGVVMVFGVSVALVVGVVVLGQILTTDVAARMSEYATLRAMGFADTSLRRILLLQSLVIGSLGYVPGVAIACLLYWRIESATALPMQMSILRIVGVLVLALGMCAAAGALSMRKLSEADPADLFR